MKSRFKDQWIIDRKLQIKEARKKDKFRTWDTSFNIDLNGLSSEFGIDLKEEISRNHSRRILDVGCGGGKALYDLAKLFPDAELHGTSIHAMNDLWDSCNGKLKNKIRFHADVSGINLERTFGNNYFDLVYSRLGLYHEVFLNKAIAQARRVLAPNGRLLLNCSNEKRELLKLQGFKILSEHTRGVQAILYLQKALVRRR